MTKCEDYFINILQKGKKFKVCFMVHNHNWESLTAINHEYENCQIDTFEGSTEFLTYRKDVANDYDLILLSSDHFYNDYEREDLESFATRISNLQQKRVTVGYLSVLSRECGDKKIRQYGKFMSFRNGNQENKPNVVIDNSFDTLDFLNLVSQLHEDLETGKTYKISKK